jgi:hypothetical protein
MAKTTHSVKAVMDYNDGVNDLLELLYDFIDRHLNTELLELRKDENSADWVIEQIQGRITAYRQVLSFIEWYCVHKIEWYDKYGKKG